MFWDDGKTVVPQLLDFHATVIGGWNCATISEDLVKL